MNFIVCPLRNAMKYTMAALPTFLAQDIGEIVVLFINNGSTDGTTQWLHTLPPNVLTMHFSPGRSMAASWNSTLSWIFDPQPRPSRGSWWPPMTDYALVVNNDVLLRPDTYRRLVEDGGQFVTCVGNDDPQCIGPPWEEPKETPRPHPDFSCYLIRQECWRTVGPFNQDFSGAYAEDSDYHVRLHRTGINAYCIDLPFYHVGAGTLKSSDETEAKRIKDHADKNRKLFKDLYGCEVGSQEYYAIFGQ